MSKKVLLPVGILLGGILISLLIILARPKPAEPELIEADARITVAVTQVQKSNERFTVRSQGTVSPSVEVELVAQVSGQITAVHDDFLDGQFFDNGVNLVTIDDSDYKAELSAAESRLADAKNQLAQELGRARQARREWRDLGEQNANDLFLRKPQINAAEAGVKSAEYSVQNAKLNLQRTKVNTPFAGRVNEKLVDLGQFVSRGTAIARIYATSSAEVSLAISDKQLALLDLPLTPSAQREQNLERKPQFPEVVLTAEIAGERREWQGKITRTAAFIDVNTRLHYAYAKIDDPFNLNVSINNDNDNAQSGPLIPGLFVEAEIQGKPMDGLVSFPLTALFNRDQVLLLDEKNNTLRRTIRVIQKNEDLAWAKETELPLGSRLVLEKQSLISNGDEVIPVSQISAP